MGQRSELSLPISRQPRLGPEGCRSIQHAIELLDEINLVVSKISSPYASGLVRLLYEAQQELIPIRDSYLRKVAYFLELQQASQPEQPENDGPSSAV